nr:oligoendopeptidase F [Candidatus Sigynarchaeota archaeon]
MPTSIEIPLRGDIPEQDKWDLTPLFKDDGTWDALFTEVENAIPQYAGFKGHLRNSARALKNALDFDQSMSRKLDRLSTYASLRYDEDTTNQIYAGLHGRIQNLYRRVAEMSSFMAPEIQAIPDATIQKFLLESDLRPYRFFLENIVRFKPHTLVPEIEEVLAMGSEMAGAPSHFFSQLDNADLRFGMIKDKSGQDMELSHGNFLSFLMNPDRDLRKHAFFQYYATYEQHKHGISAALAQSIKKDHFYTRVRKFPSCRAAALFPDNVSEAVYDNLTATVRQNLSPLADYFEIRKSALELDELHFYDVYVPIVPDIAFHMPYQEAVATAVKALQPLGEDYVRTLEQGLLKGWVDRYENRGKKSGAHSSGCYDSPPYILMNYRDDTLDSLYTLIHEAGHSMHSHYSNTYQPYLYHEYTIFVAEVASTFNEVLLSNYLLNFYHDDPRMQAYILNREIDNVRGTFYRQVMFAEFETAVHDLAEKNDPLTLETLTNTYHQLLTTHLGKALVIDEVLDLECLRIPHFYSPFYVYKYATGISAAIALAQLVIREGAPARDRYRQFLTLGGSAFPLDELRETGVDLTRPAPIEGTIHYFKDLIEKYKVITRC